MCDSGQVNAAKYLSFSSSVHWEVKDLPLSGEAAPEGHKSPAVPAPPPPQVQPRREGAGDARQRMLPHSPSLEAAASALTFALAAAQPAPGTCPARLQRPSLPVPWARPAPAVPDPPGATNPSPGVGAAPLAGSSAWVRARPRPASPAEPCLPKPGGGGVVSRLQLLTRELERSGQHCRHGGGPGARARARVPTGNVVPGGRCAAPGPKR